MKEMYKNLVKEKAVAAKSLKAATLDLGSRSKLRGLTPSKREDILNI